MKGFDFVWDFFCCGLQNELEALSLGGGKADFVESLPKNVRNVLKFYKRFRFVLFFLCNVVSNYGCGIPCMLLGVKAQISVSDELAGMVGLISGNICPMQTQNSKCAMSGIQISCKMITIECSDLFRSSQCCHKENSCIGTCIHLLLRS